MTMLGLLINMCVQALVSNKRLKDLLSADEVDANAVDRVMTSTDSEESVKVENADFSWDGDHSDPNLQDLSLNIGKSSLIAVVGRVGSGKSSLLSALLGEMEKLRGYVGVKGEVAYVPQQAWIQNMSLRDNSK
jgi:ATP-binding cassette subfamily C (CFTR/MRP) protein 1